MLYKTPLISSNLPPLISVAMSYRLEFSALYTKHITQKRKVWKDGHLVFTVSNKKLVLKDEDKKIISTHWLDNDQPQQGEQLEVENFLVEVGTLVRVIEPDLADRVQATVKSPVRPRTVPSPQLPEKPLSELIKAINNPKRPRMDTPQSTHLPQALEINVYPVIQTSNEHTSADNYQLEDRAQNTEYHIHREKAIKFRHEPVDIEDSTEDASDSRTTTQGSQFSRCGDVYQQFDLTNEYQESSCNCQSLSQTNEDSLLDTGNISVSSGHGRPSDSESQDAILSDDDYFDIDHSTIWTDHAVDSRGGFSESDSDADSPVILCSRQVPRHPRNEDCVIPRNCAESGPWTWEAYTLLDFPRTTSKGIIIKEELD